MSIEWNNNDLNELFSNDTLNCKPDPAVKSRLNYHFMLKESRSTVRQNSFLGIFSWLFSVKNIPAKTALVSIVMLISMINFQNGSENSNFPAIDSASILIPFHCDSVLKQQDSDTCSFFGTFESITNS